MPTFYFHLSDADGFFEDEDGRVLEDAGEAYKEAVRGLRDLMAGGMQSGEVDLASFIEIEDESHKLIATVFVQDAVRLMDERGRNLRRT